MLFLRLWLCSCVLAASPFLLLQGLANARLAPGPPDWNGFWQADLSRLFVDVEESEGRLELAVNGDGLDLASRAFAREPFATNALFLYAVDLRARGRTAELEQILKLAVRLDKRNRQLGVLELEQAVFAEDLPQTFAVIDRLALTNPRIIADFVRPLTALLEQEGALVVLHEALEDEPRWAEAFWNSKPETADGVNRLYQLRQTVSFGTTQETDEQLLAALGSQRLYDSVFSFWEELGVQSEVDEAAFFSSTRFQPIGWRVNVSRDSTFSELRDGEFDIFLEEQTSGELARQLVRLQPGEYVFSTDASPTNVAQNLRVGLICAEIERPVTEWQTLDESARWVIEEGCSTFWLVLEGSAWESRNGLRAVLSGMAFDRM